MVDNKNDNAQEEKLDNEVIVEGKKEIEANDANQEVDEEAFNDIANAAEDVVNQVNSSTNILTSGQESPTLDYILDVTLQVSVEVGRARMSIQDLLQLGQGAVVELEKLAGEPLDIYMNGKQVAKGEAVIVNEKFGVRVVDVISREERMLGIK